MSFRALSALGQKFWKKPAEEALDPAAIGILLFGLKEKVWVELESHALYVMPRDYIGSAILQTKSHEPHVTKLIERELKRGDVFLDIGANLGFFTMLASRIVGDGGKVISFEPNPLNLQLIYASILRNAARNVRIHPYAASDTSGILRFLTVGSNGGVINEDDKRDTSMLVQAVILDGFLKEERRIDLVKLDIEGHEISALKGMADLIRQHQPKIITEFHPWAMELNQLGEPGEYLDFLFGLNYKVAIIKDKGELIDVSSPSEVMEYRSSLGDERIHMDLFARPIQSMQTI
jgi:FkbM family methyltransferase